MHKINVKAPILLFILSQVLIEIKTRLIKVDLSENYESFAAKFTLILIYAYECLIRSYIGCRGF